MLFQPPSPNLEAIKARHRQGDIAFAERAYRALLDRDSTNHEAWYLLGIVAHQTGDATEAVQRIKKAINLRSDVAAYHGNLGIVLEALGRSVDAEASYRTAVRLDPTHGHARLALGNLLAMRGDMDGAMAALRAAIAANPADVGAAVNLGGILMTRGALAEAVAALAHAVRLAPALGPASRPFTRALLAAGRLGEAAAELERQLRLDPAQPDALCDLASARLQFGQGPVPVLLRRSLALDPSSPAAWYNLGVAAGGAGERRNAVVAYRRAALLDPRNFAARLNQGAALMTLGRFAEAADQFRACERLRPGDPLAQANLAAALVKLERPADAEIAYRNLARAQPDNVRTLGDLALALYEQGRWEEHAAVLRRAVTLAPGDPAAYGSLALALGDIGDVETAVRLGRRAVRLDPRETAPHSTLLFHLNYLDGETAANIADAHRRWGERVPVAARRPAVAVTDSAGRRLRVGYVSPDLRSHSVAWFLTPLLRAHDRRVVELFCYAEVKQPDATTERLRALCDHMRFTVGLSDEEVARLVAADGVDVLIDLAGHSPGNRLRALALRPAPVQVTWLGYPNTTGLHAIDYRLTDALVDPSGAEALHAEALVRLPGGFLCYEGPASAPEISAPPSRTNGHVTFGSFNNLPKLTPAVVAAWSRILHRVPGSRLLLKSKSLDHAPARRRLEQLFAQNGIDPARVERMAWVEGTATHLALYSRIDIGLDSFPYNGTTTTCEALWMGVPVVTLTGDRHAARVGASLLHRLELDDLVAQDVDGYVEAAIALAGNPARIAALRAGLRGRLQTSPLGNAPAFARRLESALGIMVARARSGLEPVSFQPPE